LEIQDHLASNQSLLQLRIGINLGDMIFDERGDGINVAVRLKGAPIPVAS